MSAAQPRVLDRWAEWLQQGRQRGMTPAQMARMRRQLDRVRNRVLRGARLRAGDRLLDVGAGTGLVAVEGARRAGAAGLCVALDVSADALLHALAGEPRVRAVVATAENLPFPEASFDAVTTRSVLIYVPDKAAAIREFQRVLVPGGRASIFEPINDACRLGPDVDLDLGPLRPEVEQVNRYRNDTWKDGGTMLGFDERDLQSWFVQAPFREVTLEYIQTYGPDPSNKRPRLGDIMTSLQMRPNPGMVSYEEAAVAALGERAQGHLISYAILLYEQRPPSVWAAAYVSAVK